MEGKRYEVALEKVERIKVVVDARDEGEARLAAFERERRGDADSVVDHAVSVVAVVRV